MLAVTADMMLNKGLALVGQKPGRIARFDNKKKLSLFRAEFGKDPSVLVAVWEHMQTTAIAESKIVDANDQTLEEFLWAFNFLKGYPTEAVLESRTNWCDKTIRKRIKEMLHRIAALSAEKIVWPASWDDPNVDTPVFLLSVDGTHCPIQEPTKNHKYSKNPKYYSHKFNRSGLAYEVGISIFTSQVVWVNGPFPAGMGDDDIFFGKGLKDRIPAGKKVIADGVYKRQDLPMVRTAYKADSPLVRLFKRRVRARHESFFGKMKVFNVLNDVFRHGESFHATCFMACVVICQFQIEEVPLFDP